MKKGIIKAFILCVILIAAIFLFGILMNHTSEDLTTEMAEATLPVVDIYYEEEQINQLFGYTKEMEALYMRDTITPISDDRILPIKVQTYGYPVNQISYEIRSMDTTRLIAESAVENYSSERGVITTDLEIQNILEEGTEYLFILKLESNDSSVYYYTRVMQPADCYVKESIDFVTYFHDASMSQDTSGPLATYVEQNAYGDNSNLHKVDIHSSLKQISWADFGGMQLGASSISIKEINTSYNVILVNYIMTTQGEGGELEYYNTTEYYRVRYTNERMYLLNYERTMNQIFRGENEHFYEDHIQLGIRDEEIEYKTNESGKIISFVQEGELWSYNVQESRLTQVFSFRGYEGMDDRENNNRHDIRIIKVDESGSTDFVVYGYMNRGNHEGEVGIAVYHYDAAANTVEEELFIPSTKSYELLKARIGQLMYENEKNQFYLMLDDCIYEIDMKTMDDSILITGLTDGNYAISDSNQYVAYIEGGNADSGAAINIRNLENNEIFQIDAAEGEYIRPLGFMENDFIYGGAKSKNVVEDAIGNIVFPMSYVRIVEIEGENHDILMEYHKKNYYISDIEISDFTIYLNRIEYNGTAYVEATPDTIMNREVGTEDLLTIETIVTQVKQTEYKMVLAGETELSAKKLLMPQQIVLTESKDIVIEPEEHAEEEYFYAYARGEVLTVTTDIAKAVQLANENMGVVIGDAQEYIWKRAKKALQSTIEVAVGDADKESDSIAKSLNALLGKENLNVGVQKLLDQGSSPTDILKDTMQGFKVLDITGCELEPVLYYVNRGTPIFAMTSDKDAVLLVGYDARYVTIFDPTLGSTYKRNLEEASEMFSQAGNIFLTYLKE